MRLHLRSVRHLARDLTAALVLTVAALIEEWRS